MDCKKCLPDIMPENEDALTVYLAVQDQLIVGMGGPVALNQMAIHPVMELYEIEFRADCFDKVVAVSRELMKKQQDEAEAKR